MLVLKLILSQCASENGEESKAFLTIPFLGTQKVKGRCNLLLVQPICHMTTRMKNNPNEIISNFSACLTVTQRVIDQRHYSALAFNFHYILKSLIPKVFSTFIGSLVIQLKSFFRAHLVQLNLHETDLLFRYLSHHLT